MDESLAVRRRAPSNISAAAVFHSQQPCSLTYIRDRSRGVIAAKIYNIHVAV